MAPATATAIRSKVVLGVIWDRDWGGGPHMGMFAAAIEGVDVEKEVSFAFPRSPHLLMPRRWVAGSPPWQWGIGQV
jgi:hypothetical protein